MICFAVLSIIVLFFTFALLISPLSQKIIGRKICAICAACSSTWIILLILRQLDLFDIDNTLIGVLMGGSVVGVMKELEDLFLERKLKYFWIVRLITIVVGFYLAYAVAIYDCNMILVGLIAALIVTVITIMFIRKDKKKTKQTEVNSTSQKDKITDKEKQDAIDKLESSLEDCC